MLVASGSIDKKTASAIVKALYDSRERLQNSHPALSLYSVREAGKGIRGQPLHKGAETFFDEN